MVVVNALHEYMSSCSLWLVMHPVSAGGVWFKLHVSHVLSVSSTISRMNVLTFAFLFAVSPSVFSLITCPQRILMIIATRFPSNRAKCNALLVIFAISVCLAQIKNISRISHEISVTKDNKYKWLIVCMSLAE